MTIDFLTYFSQQVQAATPETASNIWFFLLITALLLTVIVMALQQYQIAQLHKAIVAATQHVEKQQQPRPARLVPQFELTESAELA